MDEYQVSKEQFVALLELKSLSQNLLQKIKK